MRGGRGARPAGGRRSPRCAPRRGSRRSGGRWSRAWAPALPPPRWRWRRWGDRASSPRRRRRRRSRSATMRVSSPSSATQRPAASSKMLTSGRSSSGSTSRPSAAVRSCPERRGGRWRTGGEASSRRNASSPPSGEGRARRQRRALARAEPAPVDEGAVAAAQIAQLPAVAHPVQAGVLAGDARVVDAEVARRRGARRGSASPARSSDPRLLLDDAHGASQNATPGAAIVAMRAVVEVPAWPNAAALSRCRSPRRSREPGQSARRRTRRRGVHQLVVAPAGPRWLAPRARRASGTVRRRRAAARALRVSRRAIATGGFGEVLARARPRPRPRPRHEGAARRVRRRPRTCARAS